MKGFRRSVTRIAAVLVGVASALLIGELFASTVHQGAFPHLNIYVADDSYGVRLLPEAKAKTRSPRGHISEVKTNAAGFRGDEWPTDPSFISDTSRLILLGDSQTLGLHVAQQETFASQLDRRSSIEAFNLGVPTWGPHEYARATQEWAPRLKATHVVYIANVWNDWFEATVPNSRRTTASDGWAHRVGDPNVRSTTRFGTWFRSSHLAYAALEVLNRASMVTKLRADEPIRIAREVRQLSSPQNGHRSRLMSTVEETKRACLAVRCKLLVATLPLDVQVNRGEWAKYRHAPVDMRGTERLSFDLIADARAARIDTLDLLPVLRRAEPGAFLSDDPHLSEKGHRAVAEAIHQWVSGTQTLARNSHERTMP